MINTIQHFAIAPFLPALKAFFKDLNLPLHYISDLPARPEDILGDKYKAHDKTHALIEEVYPLGLVDEAVFNHTNSLFSDKWTTEKLQKIAQKYEGLLIFGLTLKAQPTRSDLAEITRAFNRAFPYMPVMLVFRYENYLTLAHTERTEYKQAWREGEKMGKVTLLKDINIENPHTGHIHILQKLVLQRAGKEAIYTFAQLYAYWQTVLNVATLNKRFYKELFEWYLWAVPLVKYPKPETEMLEEISHQSISVIRLLTRLIFVWFIKEKKLVNEALFDAATLAQILQDFDPQSPESANYYQGILQNLFFATLNSPMNRDAEKDYEKRQFVEDLPLFQGKNPAYNDKTKYRGAELFADKEQAMQLFAETPFLNGGLFECLDFIDEQNKENRYDGFSATPQKRAFVPNNLFFGKANIDLSEALDDKKRKDVQVRGIIEILNSYTFTIAENTPLDEEVALDPELLGKVFENLLASYNPETSSSARKQTGSFYTPREIVDYMVEESLKAYLEKSASQSGAPSKGAPLSALFSYTDSENPFDANTTEALIQAISACKILDPACGSGAYPMGVLNMMVHILKKLDPKNLKWKTTLLQKAEMDLKSAQNFGDEVIRNQAIGAAEHRIQYIKDSFAESKHELDYTRKLFLIENCIYGVDIQQIAVQISKLRFFISLIVEQQITETARNRGILSMPNLETKFVAANTLIGLEKQANTLISPQVIQAEKELDEIRKEIFFVKKWKDKKILKQKEAKKRIELKAALLESGFGEKTAAQKTAWNPFDVIHSAPFFDAETMFGEELSLGFDVVIGNPPYGFRTVLTNDEKNYFRKVQKIEFSSGDSAELFVKICFDRHLADKGILSFIIPKKSLYGDAWEDTRVNYWKKYHLQFLLDTGKSFDNVLLEASVFGLSKSARKGKVSLSFLGEGSQITTFNNVAIDNIFVKSNSCQIYKVLYPDTFFAKIQAKSFPEKMVEGKLGLAIGTDFFSDTIKTYKLLKGIDIEKYNVRSHRYLDNEEKLNWKNAQAFLSPKVLCQRLVAHVENPIPHLKITACYDAEGILITNTLMSFELNEGISPKFWLAYLNSKFLSWYAYNFVYSRAIRGMDFYNFYIQQLPIPNISIAEQQPIIALVDKILALKSGSAPSKGETQALEAEIDALVYRLYDLTAEEIAMIEGGH